jgi:hypothetical protein
VLGVLAAARAEFLQAQTLFHVLLVLGCADSLRSLQSAHAIDKMV